MTPVTSPLTLRGSSRKLKQEDGISEDIRPQKISVKDFHVTATTNNSVNTCNTKKRKNKKINNNIDIIDVDDEELQHQAEEPHEVRILYVLTSSTSMETAINNIRNLCPQHFKLATPGIITQIHHFGLTKQQFLQECASVGEEVSDTDTIAIPTFFGDISNGHWYLAIIQRQHGVTNGYMIDLTGYSPERTSYVHHALGQVDINVDDWTYFASVRQHELECGPRVIYTICDVLDQLQDGSHIEFALGNLSKYNVTPEILSRQSRATMQDAIENRLDADNLINFLIMDDINDESNYLKKVPVILPNKTRATNQANTHHATIHFMSQTTSSAIAPSPSPQQKNDGEGADQHTPIMERMITHHDDGNGEKTFYFHRTGYTDDILFACNNAYRKRLHKKDRRLLNQYIATKQGKFLYHTDMVLLRVLNKEKKMIDNRYMTHRDTTKATIYLTKRGNGKDIIISWEPETRAVLPLEIEYIRSLKKGRIQQLKPMNTTTADKSPWGNVLKEKQENHIRICMENVNNIVTLIKGNHKLDQAKTWLIKHEIDVACWIELGVPWHRRRLKEKLKSMMRCDSWDDQLTVAANNVHEETGRRQFGGTATLAFNSMVATVASSGVDTSGLGRWSWMKFQGKLGKSTTIISVYCPCKSDGKQPETVYSQHKRYLMSKHQDVCPREAFRRDVSIFISKCRSRHEQIILCIDLN